MSFVEPSGEHTMSDLPSDLALALASEAIDESFERLQPDVRANFTSWLEHAEDDALRKRRIQRIVSAVKAIRAELGDGDQ